MKTQWQKADQCKKECHCVT